MTPPTGENCYQRPAVSCLYELITATSRRMQNNSAEEKEEGEMQEPGSPPWGSGCGEAGGIPGMISVTHLAIHAQAVRGKKLQ